jgi:hypothetical protein
MRGLGLGCLEQLTGLALDFDPVIGVGDGPSVRCCGDDQVQDVLDRVALFRQGDGLEGLDHALPEPGGDERVLVLVELLLAGLLDRLDDRAELPFAYSSSTGWISSSQRSGAPFV